jgi:hypothetical protein
MKFLSLFTLIFFSSTIYSQNLVTLRGKVVEIKENKSVGVPGVTVSVSGESYDITGQDGSFKLIAPNGLDYVTISIKGSSSPMISPYEGKINLPLQYEPIEIKLCNENNKRLTRKVAELNSKIKSLQKTQKLSNQQTELLQRTMIDTILYYQTQVEFLAEQNEKSNAENSALKEKIRLLEEKNTDLEQKLFLALGERFKNQQVYFEKISTGINNYISRLKDMQLILPTDAVACVSNTTNACPRFYGSIEKYNQARNNINEHKDELINATKIYWSNDEIHTELSSLLDYILNTIHEPMMFNQMNLTILNVIKERSQGNISLSSAKKEIKLATAALSADLKPLIIILDKKKAKLFHDFTNFIQ